MSKWRHRYKVHPAADLFPMMSDEELTKLAEDIKANGLQSPITFTMNDVLLDGRNRLEAMERAGVDFKSWNRQTVTNAVDPEATPDAAFHFSAAETGPTLVKARRINSSEGRILRASS
jgi:ParB-like chromosome segregation protein Spo0J